MRKFFLFFCRTVRTMKSATGIFFYINRILIDMLASQIPSMGDTFGILYSSKRGFVREHNEFSNVWAEFLWGEINFPQKEIKRTIFVFRPPSCGQTARKTSQRWQWFWFLTFCLLNYNRLKSYQLKTRTIILLYFASVYNKQNE